MEDKYLSIITNFGCHYKCPECIVRENGLQIPKTTIEGLNRLSYEFTKGGYNWLSISGGGDPLYNIDKNIDWYEALFSKLDKTDCKNIEMHTSYTDPINQQEITFDNLYSIEKLLYLFNRIVYHVHTIKELDAIHRCSGSQKVRAVFVVSDDMTEDMILKISEYVKNSNEIDELSFRQRVDNNYQPTYHLHEFLKNGHKKDWWYIEQEDYNVYYSENKIENTFKRYKKSIDK